VFEEVSDLVQSALDGFKVCLFSYGQTGAGKTHTMQGSRSYEGQGIIPRAISKVCGAGMGWDGMGCCTKAQWVAVASRYGRGVGQDEAAGPAVVALPRHSARLSCTLPIWLPPLRSQILGSVAKLREQGWEYGLEASFIEVMGLEWPGGEPGV